MSMSGRGRTCAGRMLAWLPLILIVPVLSAEDTLAKPERWSVFEQNLQSKGVQVNAPALQAALTSNPDTSVRTWAAMVLGLRHDEIGRQALRRAALTDSDSMVREQAWVALGRLGDESAVGALEKLLGDAAKLDHRLWLAAELAELGDPIGYPSVEQAVKSPNPVVRAASLPILVEFISLSGALTSDPFDLMKVLAEDMDSGVRLDTLVYLQVAVSRGASAEDVAGVFAEVSKLDENSEVRERARLQLLLLESFTSAKKKQGREQ